ncbi:hypothetical protein [Nocardia sp. NPDC057668]|uniref:hypothetical protein n=1 Tax=Nocardia sp. NPDC057668 TaxID=3346202 RepID=UPI00366C3A39
MTRPFTLIRGGGTSSLRVVETVVELPARETAVAVIHEAFVALDVDASEEWLDHVRRSRGLHWRSGMTKPTARDLILIDEDTECPVDHIIEDIDESPVDVVLVSALSDLCGGLTRLREYVDVLVATGIRYPRHQPVAPQRPALRVVD